MSFRTNGVRKQVQKKKWSSDRECEERLERFSEVGSLIDFGSFPEIGRFSDFGSFSEDGPFGGVGNFGDVGIFSDGGSFGEVGKIKCL